MEGSPDELLARLPEKATRGGGTNFTHALQVTQQELEDSWATERSVTRVDMRPLILTTNSLFRSPVVVFLSDGQSAVRDETMYDLCRTSIRLGYAALATLLPSLTVLHSKPLAFHSISFGREDRSQILKRMATIARDEYAAIPPDPLMGNTSNPCSFHEALDTVRTLLIHFRTCDSLLTGPAS
jgi:hypothetical protein